MRKRKWLSAGLLLIMSICMLLPDISIVSAKNKAHTVTANKGVYIGDIDIQGMTNKEIRAAVNAYIREFTDKKITLSMDNNTSVVSVKDLGYYWSNKDIVNDALEYGNKGNILEKYKERKKIERDNVRFEIETSISEKKMKQAINDNCAKYNIPHINAGLIKNGNSFTITESRIGRKIAVGQSVKGLSDYLLNSWDGKDSDYKLVVVDDKPVSVEEDCKKVTDVLGTFSTYFGTNGNYNRNMNMRNGMNLINGTVVYPGETFSANAMLEPWTEDNGWYNAGTYVNGRVEDSLGGGICQVSSTLYNAVLLAELDVVERYPHSMNVDYVELAADAALAGTWKDLKFANNTDVPVYVEGIYDTEGKLTFTIYGDETREPGRTIKYVSETLSTNYPQEVVTEDPGKPEGYRLVTTKGHIGYTAKLWKEIYKDGKLVEKVVVNKSTYQSAPIYVTYGTGKAEEEPTKKPEKPTKKPEKPTKKPEKPTKKPEETTTQMQETTEKHQEADMQEETVQSQQ